MGEGSSSGRRHAMTVVLLTVLLMALSFLSRGYADRLSVGDGVWAGIMGVVLVFFWRGSRIAKWFAVVVYAYSGILLFMLGIAYGGSAFSVAWSFVYFAATACLLQPTVAEFQASQRMRCRPEARGFDVVTEEARER